MSRKIRGLVVGLAAGLVGLAGVVSEGQSEGPAVLVSQKTNQKKKGTPPKKGTAKKDDDAMAGDAGKSAAPADGALSFKRDIAPILVANCVGCHSGNGRGLARSRFDMSTFEKLMAGGKRGKDDIVAGDPETSHLVLMIKGEETPKMPPANGQMGFSEDAVAKIEAWVKSGAKLDAGISATEPLSKYAATAADIRKADQLESESKAARQRG